MTNYIILHGDGGIDMWIPWLQKELEKRAGEVWVPTLPDSNSPNLKTQLPFLLQSGKFNEETVIIGHSSGCPLILSTLENLKTPIQKAVLVAGYIKPLKNGRNPDPGLQETYNWQKIKQNCKEFVFIVSDNDPWGCDENMNRPVFDQIGGTFVVVKDGGHFGSNTFKSPLYEFPLLLNLV